MRISIKKWGNSPAIRIPVSFMHSVDFQLDQVVNIREEDGKLIIESVQIPKFSLDSLVDGISPENCHEEIATGSPRGAELW